MWIVAKFNNGQENLFKQELSKNIKNIILYSPKVKINFFKNNKLLCKDKSLLCSYLFCFSKEFSDSKIIDNMSGLKGLSYFLRGERLYQKEVSQFINDCKLHEDDKGYIKKEFADLSFSNLYKFNSGPFTNLLFKLIEKNKTQIKISIGNKNIFLKKNLSYSYQLA